MKTLSALRLPVASLLACCTGAVAFTQTTTLVSVDSIGVQGDDESRSPSISEDGRWIAFDSLATNLVAGDVNGLRDVFVHDALSGLTELVSRGSSGSQGNGESWAPSISADGRWVAFASTATNLVPGDTNAAHDVFLCDRLTPQLTRVSLTSGGAQAAGFSYDPELSADGRFVAFTSTAADLVPGDTNGVEDVFLRDLLLGLTVRASLSSSGGQGDKKSSFPSLSDDGRFVAFASQATNLVPGDSNSVWDVFVRDIVGGLTLRVSVSSAGVQGDQDSRYPSVSADGLAVAFASPATNLVVGDTNLAPDVFVHELTGGLTTRVSVSSSGTQGNGSSEFPSLSSGGQFVAFMSAASNLVPGDANGRTDVFVHDRGSGLTTRESLSTAGIEGDSYSFFPSVSAGGTRVAFQSLSVNLVPGDSNLAWDVFLRERGGCAPNVTTYCSASTTSLAGCQAAISGSGTPSLANPTAFSFSSGPIPGSNIGLAIFGVSGPAAVPFGTQGGFICVGSPVYRANGKSSGGNSGVCNGALVYTLQDLIVSHPGVITLNATVHASFWFRDPAGGDKFALADGIAFTLCQ